MLVLILKVSSWETEVRGWITLSHPNQYSHYGITRVKCMRVHAPINLLGPVWVNALCAATVWQLPLPFLRTETLQAFCFTIKPMHLIICICRRVHNNDDDALPGPDGLVFWKTPCNIMSVTRKKQKQNQRGLKPRPCKSGLETGLKTKTSRLVLQHYIQIHAVISTVVNVTLTRRIKGETCSLNKAPVF